MNRQVEYDEFKAINVAAFLQECKNPLFNWKNRFPAYDDRDQDPISNEQLTPEIFVSSDVSINHEIIVFCSSSSKRCVPSTPRLLSAT